jgi:PadR family transcriptional regulator, regulatory protein PadR
MDTNITEQSDKLIMELRRGLIVLAVLSQLRETQYGYSLKQSLADRGLDVEEGTLYPLLRRLESQGLLKSEWQVEDAARPRRYYRISPDGLEVLTRLTMEWSSMVGVMNHLLKPNGGS